MSKPTPGPWEVQRLNHTDGELWLQIGYRDPSGVSRGPIADVVSKQWIPAAELQYLVAPETEQWANAHLLAAAPDMFATLLEIDDHLNGERLALMHETPCNCRVCTYYLPLVRATISKARGEVPT